MAKTIDIKAISGPFRLARHSRAYISKRRLAKILNIQYSVLSRFENGRDCLPIATLELIFAAGLMTIIRTNEDQSKPKKIV